MVEKKPSKRCNSASVGMSCTNIEVCFFSGQKVILKVFSLFPPFWNKTGARLAPDYFFLTPLHSNSLNSTMTATTLLKRGGMDGLSEGRQGCSEGFPEDKGWWKSRDAALPARGKTPSILTLLLGFTFYFNRTFWWPLEFFKYWSLKKHSGC